MQTQNQQTGVSPFDEHAETYSCPSCQAAMVRGMRFCRMCGYRLGEGVEEYAETRLLDPEAPGVTGRADARPTAPRAMPNSGPAGMPNGMPNAWGAMTPGLNTTSLDARPSSSLRSWTRSCGSMRMGWVMWLIISLAVLSAVGGMTRGLRRWRAGGPPVVAAAPKSFLGVDGFDTAESGGAFIQGLAAPDTPVERAGLLGGDVIVKFDGKTINNKEDMTRALRETPPGKTVEVVYMRDSETRTTMLTTMAEKDFRGLDALDARPGGRGYLGIGDFERVRVGDSTIYGVRIDDLRTNRPADLAGLKEGDVITEFNGKPVRTEGDIRLRIYEAVPGSTVTVVLMRDGTRMEIPVKIGKGRD